jgi:quinol monooxygenase YgiN
MINLFGYGATFEALAPELFSLFEQWENEVKNAEPIFKIEGERIERLARDIPHHQVFYAQRAQDAKAVVKWLEIMKAQKESRHIKNYNNSPRALAAREQAAYIQGEKDIVEFNQMIVHAALIQQQFEEIVEAVKQMGWMLTSIVKLRVAEAHDSII